MNWTLIAITIGINALTGFLVAAKIDYEAFKKWESYKDAYSYDWKLAGWRWFRGTVIGVASGSGVSAALMALGVKID